MARVPCQQHSGSVPLFNSVLFDDQRDCGSSVVFREVRCRRAEKSS
jgi:hypothetical protein